MTKYVIAIGIFDGLHSGHREIINTTVKTALKLKCKSMIMSFSVNPKADGGVRRTGKILSDRMFSLGLDIMGVQKHVIIDFSPVISKLSGRDFIRKLCSDYQVEALVAGSSFRCGNLSDSLKADQLKSELSVYNAGSDVLIVPSVEAEGVEVSSTALRKFISDGDFERFRRFSGYPFVFDLSGLSCRRTQSGFVFDTGASVQLVPGDGEYRVYTGVNASFLSMPSPWGCDIKAVISDCGRKLELHVSDKPANLIFPYRRVI